jgi:ABC-type sulfate/molybdate transport systems ATPase subunit
LTLDQFSLDLDLTAPGGQIVGLTGDIGSGKSTTLALIAGRHRATSGVIAFGQQVWDEPETNTFVADRPVTMLSQRFQNDLPEDLTGVEAVVKHIVAHQPGHPDPEGAAREVLADLGVGDHVVDRLPWTFSGAEAQRVSLARALAPRPAVVLLDEPFGAMDKRTGTNIRAWMVEWFADYEGVVLIASTRVEHLKQLTDHIVDLSA